MSSRYQSLSAIVFSFSLFFVASAKAMPEEACNGSSPFITSSNREVALNKMRGLIGNHVESLKEATQQLAGEDARVVLRDAWMGVCKQILERYGDVLSLVDIAEELSRRHVDIHLVPAPMTGPKAPTDAVSRLSATGPELPYYLRIELGDRLQKVRDDLGLSDDPIETRIRLYDQTGFRYPKITDSKDAG